MASLVFECRTMALGVRTSRDQIGAQQALAFERGVQMSRDLTGANRPCHSNIHPWHSNIRRLNLSFEQPLQRSNVNFWPLNV